MPVEIKELVIRAVVQPEAGSANAHPTAEPGAMGPGSGADPDEREAIVAAAVKEVLRILKASRER